MRSRVTGRSLKAAAKAFALAGFVATFGALALGNAQAAVFYQGVDGAGTTASSDAAYSAWQTNVVGGGTVDDLSTLSCAGNFCNTALGNQFFKTQGISLTQASFNLGVIDGENLQLSKTPDGAVTGQFIWNLAGSGANSFGFFGHENDGGLVTVEFSDGTSITQNIATASGSFGNMFFGVTGANALIDMVSISTTDPQGISNWDNFVVGTTVPVPAALPLFLSALVAVGLVGRRKRRSDGEPAMA
jgi:hypothetical protein